ncbi:repressor LexA, partial [human gut metagenome]
PEDTTFGVRISGDSMEPEFHDGQIAWVLQHEIF